MPVGTGSSSYVINKYYGDSIGLHPVDFLHPRRAGKGRVEKGGGALRGPASCSGRETE